MAQPTVLEPQGTVDNIPVLNASDIRTELNGLSPNTKYSVSLNAYTASGRGDITTVINQTDEGGK